MSQNNVSVSRRAFLAYTGRGIAAGAIGLPLLLEACTPPTAGQPPSGAPAPGTAPTSTSATSASARAAVRLPTHVPYQGGPQPDLPGDDRGVDPGYYRFPSQLARSVTQTPGDGSEVSAVGIITLAAPPPMDQNTLWQAVNKAVGATLRMTMVTTQDYPTKINTLLAGSDLPDFIYNSQTSTGVIPLLPEFARARCEDLTDHLADDAVKDYPNLANYSTYSWRSGVVGGRLYGVPVARSPLGNIFSYREDLFEQAGIKLDRNAFADAHELKRALVALTRPNESQWGMAQTSTQAFGLATGFGLPAVFRAPNNWRVDASGKLTKDFETAEYRAAVGFARDLFAAGVYHPNTPTYGSAALEVDFRAGRSAMYSAAWGSYLQQWGLLAASNPAGRVRPMHPFAHDGGNPIYPAGTGHFGVTFIRKQSSPERVKMLLRVMNFFGAPFGTEEWLLQYYGPRDTNHTSTAEGAPMLTTQGRAESSIPFRYISSTPPALFDPVKSKDYADIAQAAERAYLDVAEFDPTVGLYSQSAFNLGIPAQETFYAGVSDIVTGRRPMTEFDDIVSTWRMQAGDKMRAEYQAALEAAKT